MLLLFSGLLLAVGAASAGLCFWAHMRIVAAHEKAAAPVADVSHYRPMLRLLVAEDFDLPSDNETRGEVLARRRRVFREYLHSLTVDYGRLLAGIRLTMIQSGVDRPDLAKALLRHRASFAIALCRIELRLRLHALGFGTEDLSELAVAFNVLQRQIAALADSTVWGS
jgi:hypothetical protein